MKCLHFSHMTPISINGRKASWWRKGTIPECVNNTGHWLRRGPSATPASAMSLAVGLPMSDPAQDALGWTIRVFWELSTQRGLLWTTWCPPAPSRVGSALLVGKPTHCWLDPFSLHCLPQVWSILCDPRTWDWTLLRNSVSVLVAPRGLELGGGWAWISLCPPLPSPTHCSYPHPFKSDWSDQGIFGGKKG